MYPLCRVHASQRLFRECSMEHPAPCTITDAGQRTILQSWRALKLFLKLSLTYLHIHSPTPTQLGLIHAANIARILCTPNPSIFSLSNSIYNYHFLHSSTQLSVFSKTHTHTFSSKCIHCSPLQHHACSALHTNFSFHSSNILSSLSLSEAAFLSLSLLFTQSSPLSFSSFPSPSTSAVQIP